MAKVTMYTTRNCPFSKMEKDYLDLKGIVYEEVFIDEYPQRAQEVVEISGQMGVPFTVIEKSDGKTFSVLGFDKVKLDQALS